MKAFVHLNAMHVLVCLALRTLARAHYRSFKRQINSTQSGLFEVELRDSLAKAFGNSFYHNGLMLMDDPHDLARFVQAQTEVYDQVLREIQAGLKDSHWMWFVFPQIEGLGHSSTAKRYSIKSKAEAAAYVANPVLGQRLAECCNALLCIEGRSAHDIFGSPDDSKLRSCMTLFAQVSPPGSVFEDVLEKYFDRKPDQLTIRLLDTEDEPGAH